MTERRWPHSALLRRFVALAVVALVCLTACGSDGSSRPTATESGAATVAEAPSTTVESAPVTAMPTTVAVVPVTVVPVTSVAPALSVGVSVSAAEVDELIRQLDEIDRVLDELDRELKDD